jgi:serine/threonine protein kinase/tetratricopeptide (TPR) repeat protein
MAEQPPSLKELFLAALAVPPAERAGWLEGACARDVELRRRVELMLEAHDTPQSLLDRLAPAAPLEAATGPLAGARTEGPASEAEGAGALVGGRYKLLEPIGEGGMGAVWMAQQTEPVKRLVALKLIKPGMDSKQVLARFEAERQALALMDHPNIARVLDAGATAAGRPYFVMELVKGVSITRYCDEHRLTPRQRLELFVPVCQAVQHAHQKGVVHRDIKPSNVLVALYDDRPSAKVIDFGIAKATGQALTDKTLVTGFGAVVGTLEYMSPEQAQLNQLDVDTRSDVYSLGVLLYELLTGTTPLEKKRLREAAMLEILRLIREEEPPRPSARLSTTDEMPSVAANRGLEPRKLSGLVRGDLDWIVMKALEKDRNRRYETANGLAMDVQRFLADEPVLASPPSAWYRLRKFVRRRRRTATAGAAVVVVVLAATAVSTWQAVRATFAEKATGNALARVTHEQAKTQAALAAAGGALEALTDVVVETMFARQPELDDSEKAFLRKVLGHYEAVALQLPETAETEFLRAKGHYQGAHLRQLLGESAEAVAGYQQAARLLGPLADAFPQTAEYRHKLARTNGNVGILLAEAGQEREAEAALRRGIALRMKLVEDSPKDAALRAELATAENDLGYLLERREDYAGANKAYRAAVERQEKVVADAGDVARHHRDLARLRSNLGQYLRKQDKLTEADTLYEQAVKVQEEQLGKFPDVPKVHRQLADSYQGWGIVRAEQHRMDKAEEAFARSVELRKKLTVDFPRVVVYRRELASLYNDVGFLMALQKKNKAAEEAYRNALAIQEKLAAERGSIAAHRQEVANTYSNLASLLQQRKEFAEAVLLLEKARAHLQAALDANAKNPVARRLYRENQQVIARGFLLAGDHAGLAAAADELARFAYAPADDAYAAAGMLSRCAALVAKDAGLAAGRRKELAQGYTGRALRLLSQAVGRGFKDAARMKTDPNLAPLLTRPEVQKLLAGLEGK